MKAFYQKYIAILVIANLLLTSTGCKKFLEEDNPGGRTAETYYSTKQGFEDLIRSNYTPLRSIYLYGNLYWLGTDAFSTGITTDANPMNLYSASMNPSLSDLDTCWKKLYYSVQLTNTALYWADKVTDLDAATLAVRKGEVKALRALYYYMLAETWGDVPLVLTPSDQPTFGYTRTAEQQIYDQIIQDLTEAIDALPVASTANFGRVTKGMAQHLLAKVYLTRGYKSYAGATDFTKAAELAEAVIAGPYTLLSDFTKLFDPAVSGFQVNTEVIFSVQYSSTTATNGTGNWLHQHFTMDMPVYPAIGRSSYYNKSQQAYVPTPWFFTIFDKTRDARYSGTVHTAIYAQVASGVFAVGDTVIYFPDVAWTAAQKAAVKYYVYNPDEYRTVTTFANRSFPSFKKFREVGMAYADGLGTRDTYVFRLAETYLIAAEAYLKANNLTEALNKFNAVRKRGGKTGTNPATGLLYKDEMAATALTIDDILDERARELAGEELRWFELKRTGKLVERTLLRNDEAKATAKLQSFHTLRPIPQNQIDLNRGELGQNLGYQ